MRLTGADRWRLDPGEVTTWRAEALHGGSLWPAPLTLNQRNHVQAALRTGRATWLAATVTVPGEPSVDEVERAFRRVLRRHPALRTEVLSGQDGRLGGGTIEAEALELLPEPSWTEGDPRKAAARLAALCDERCAPGQVPSVMPAMIRGPGRTTLVLAFDHQHGDAISVALLAAELDEELRHAAEVRPRQQTHLAYEPPADPDDPDTRAALDAWERQLAAVGHQTPTFPLPLGLGAGQWAPQATVVETLATGAEIAGVGARGRALGASTFGVVLAALAAAVQDLKWFRPEVERAPLYLLLPVSTRREQDRDAVGWFTTSVPVVLPVRRPEPPGVVSRDRVDEAASQLRLARRMATVPLGDALDSLSTPLRWTHSDLFTVSYVDYTRLPGSDRICAQHVSAATESDDVQLWLARTRDGLALRARIPDTVLARTSLTALVRAWRHRLC